MERATVTFRIELYNAEPIEFVAKTNNLREAWFQVGLHASELSLSVKAIVLVQLPGQVRR